MIPIYLRGLEMKGQAKPQDTRLLAPHTQSVPNKSQFLWQFACQDRCELCGPEEDLPYWDAVSMIEAKSRKMSSPF